MKKAIKFIGTAILLFTGFMFEACEGLDSNVSIEKSLVVEGWIASDNYPVVMVSKVVPIEDKVYNVDELGNYVMHWAKVTISDGSRDVTLMGKYDKRYMPPYIYTTTEMKGEVGKKYDLYVEADGKEATASTTIPVPMAIDSIAVEPDPERPLGHMFYAAFCNESDNGHFALFYKVGRNSQQFNLSTMGVFDNSVIDKGTVRYPVYISDNLMEETDSSMFDIRPQYLCVRLASVDSISYKYWKDFLDTYTMSDNFLMPYTNPIRGNVSEAYGCWSGLGVSDMWVEVKD